MCDDVTFDLITIVSSLLFEIEAVNEWLRGHSADQQNDAAVVDELLHGLISKGFSGIRSTAIARELTGFIWAIVSEVMPKNANEASA